MSYNSFPIREEMLLETLQSAENTAILLRHYATSVLNRHTTYISGIQTPTLPVSIEFTPAGWLTINLPEILPRRGREDRARFLSLELVTAINLYYAKEPLPKFQSCVLVYEHIYDRSRNRRFIDHDNLELKHCQDALESAFLVNDTSALCCAFQCSHRGEKDATRIWVLRPEEFQTWLNTYSELWMGAPKN